MRFPVVRDSMELYCCEVGGVARQVVFLVLPARVLPLPSHTSATPPSRLCLDFQSVRRPQRTQIMKFVSLVGRDRIKHSNKIKIRMPRIS